MRLLLSATWNKFVTIVYVRNNKLFVLLRTCINVSELTFSDYSFLCYDMDGTTVFNEKQQEQQSPE